MGSKTFNMDDELYNKFSQTHKGDMSKILSQLLNNYLEIKKENLQLVKLKANLTKVQNQIEKLKQEESNLKIFITQLEEEYKKELEQEQVLNKEALQWVNDEIRRNESQGTTSELHYNAEKSGLSVQDYLLKEWESKQQ